MYNSEKRSLRFNENGKFKILMISDFHANSRKIHEDNGKRYSQKLIDGIEALVKTTEPDFVMVGGDACIGSEEGFMRQAITDIMEPIQKRGIPWAYVYGNHDDEGTMTKKEQQKVYESFPLCLSQAGPDELYGVGNYVLPVYSYKDEEKRAYNIFCLDSNRELIDELKLYGVSDKDNNAVLPYPFGMGKCQSMPVFSQVMWYYDTSEEIEEKEGRKIPAILCMHNPTIEYNLIYRNPEETGMLGSKRESPACSELNSGLFFACLERGDVKGIFCGHEHLNTYQGQYCGITLAYDGCAGYDMSAHDDLRGGRVIELDENEGSFTTRFISFVELMGQKAWRNESEFEGGWNTQYFIRNTWMT